MSVFALVQAKQVNEPHASANELFHLMPDILKHPSHLPLSALVDYNLHVAGVLGRRITHQARAGRSGGPVFQFDSSFQARNAG